MEKFIIELKIKINGEWETSYHEKLELNNRIDVENVYTPFSNIKSKALVFYDKEEAQKMASFLTDSFCVATVIPKK